MKKYKAMIKSIQEDITKVELKVKDGRKYYEEDLADLKKRLKLIRKYQRDFKEIHVVQQMMHIAEEKVDRYLADFYYHDLRCLSQYNGRFIWYVGDCGTHFISIDCKDQEHFDSSKSHLDAVEHYYSRYDRYLIDQQRGSIQRINFKDIEIRIKPIQREEQICQKQSLMV